MLGAAITGAPLVWDVTLTQCLYYVLGMVLSLLVGFMLGVLIRASTGAIVAYFVLTFLLPTLFGLLADEPGVVPRPAALGRHPVRPERPVRLRPGPHR